MALRLHDATAPPNFMEVDYRRNEGAAREAIEYFFDPESAFADHLELLGGSAVVMRLALLSDRPLAAGSPFTAEQRKHLQVRHTWWLESYVAATSTSSERIE